MTSVTPWAPPALAPGTEVERLATGWIAPYGQELHLRRARDWLVHLVPDATAEARLAALTHDIERMFPGGPVLDHANTDWDDPFYLFAHSLRSADAVTVWLGGVGPVAAEVDVAEVRRLVGLHEVGGLSGGDELQAADSLSFLETLADLTAGWVTSGACSREKAAAKLQYMAERVRVPAAQGHVAEWLDWASARLPEEE
ncbi:hypothetical protein LY13_000299 [Prauserella aidingensis]|uniref:hypothetical protein n=1 Tax=Prauserella aidingensis TaxID=387890 RepID=UPI0020A59B2E|nr:hypothetical protein [Prauserella aidingensis]MCP2251571.1 hypothetical protein [Prauserella aidingensis]